MQRFAQLLHELTYNAFNAGHESPEKIRLVVDRMRETGRLWEAAGWCYAAMQIPGEQAWAIIEFRKIETHLQAKTPFILARANPANEVDLSEWELPPAEKKYLTIKQEQITAPSPSLTKVRIHEEARAKGIQFWFNNSASEFARIMVTEPLASFHCQMKSPATHGQSVPKSRILMAMPPRIFVL